MTMSHRKRVVIVSAIVSLVLLAGWALFRRSKADHVQLEVRLLGVNHYSNGVMQVTLELSNASPQVLNVVDDNTGSPALILEVPGQTTWLTRLANSGEINLGATSNLTTTAWITNAPAKFRLLFSIRDLDAERRMSFIRQYLPNALSSRFSEWTRDQWNPTNSASPWIE